MLDMFRSLKAKFINEPPPLSTPAEKREASAALIDEVTKLPKDKKKKEKKKSKKAEEKAKKQGTAKLVRAVELEAAAQAQRQSEVSSAATEKMEGVQAQVDQVTGLMHDNMRKLLARGEKLEDINRRAEELRASSLGLKKETKILKRDMQIKYLVLGLILLFLVLGLISGIYFCIFYGIFSKTAIPIIATTTGIGGAVGFLAGIILEQIYGILKNTPLFNSGLKKTKKQVDTVLEKMGPKFEKEQTLSSEQNEALQSLLKESKPPVSFATLARPTLSSLPEDDQTELSHNLHKSARSP
jgi:hypothetical protein